MEWLDLKTLGTSVKSYKEICRGWNYRVAATFDPNCHRDIRPLECLAVVVVAAIVVAVAPVAVLAAATRT